MPKLYEYLGIAIWFYSDEHNPIHVHAKYGDNEVKVELYETNGIVYDVQYKDINGKFSPAKMRDLKLFINENKNAILYAWKQVFEQNVKLKPIKITKRIR
ncbi:MAG: DUF4160 domain-containing protein [Lentimicrobiaceae bacterium]|nr:DUF4160 domain-containing protein [Lentimicrobiaceae bacterium]